MQAQRVYYALHGFYHSTTPSDRPGTSYDETLGIDARGNKYFRTFYSRVSTTMPLPITWAGSDDFYVGLDITNNGKTWRKYDAKTGEYTDNY